MSAIVVLPATAERWQDVATLFEGDGPLGCWCQYWRRSSGEYSRGKPGSGERNLRSQVNSAPPAPGVIAYVDGEPAGWCGLGPRTAMERLVRSRTIPNVDDAPVWSIVCFKVRVGFRRQGVSRALLDGAVAYARAVGHPSSRRTRSTRRVSGWMWRSPCRLHRRLRVGGLQADHRDIGA